jgi:serine/threonine-protein kinase
MTRAPQRLEDAQIMARSLERGTQQSVTQGTDARYVYPGYLIFLRLGTLLAAPFDATRLALTGGVVGLLDGVMQSAQASTWNLDAAAGQFSVSATGTLAYVRGGIFAEELRSLVWVDRSGSTNPIAMPSRQYWAPRLSSNGQRMAVYSRGREGRIWVHDFRTGTTIPLTDTGGISEFPVWMADSGLVTFALQADGSQNLFERVVDGSSGVARLTRDPTTQIPNAWSPDGTHLAFVQLTPSGSEIWILTRRHDGPITAKPWRTTHSRDQHADWSPDGQWIAYTSNESGRAEVYLQPYPGPGPRIPVSRDGGTTPVWSRNGRELFYLTSQGTSVGVGTYTMMAAPITLGPPVTVGMPQKLFEGRFLISATGRGYDVTPDGRRFVMVQPRQELAMPATEVVIVQNWLEELKARVPAR